jgi:uncharacterized protein YndB with AHSA1/START domain
MASPMKFARAFAWPQFVLWTLATVVMLVVVAQHPLDRQWWLTLGICIGGMALYFPFPVSVRVRKTITIERPITVVYDFLSQPANLHIWNPRVGAAHPDDIPAQVGQGWTYSPKHRWTHAAPMRHVFSRLEPPHVIEITATGHGVRGVNTYTLGEVGNETELTVDASVSGLPAPVAWGASALGRLFPSADLARLKRALEHRGPTRYPSSG